MRKLLIIVPLLGLLVASVWFAIYSWTAIEGPPMPLEGHVAMWLGIVFSLDDRLRPDGARLLLEPPWLR